MGTDLSQAVVARARAGEYAAFEVGRGLPATMLMRHFSKGGLEWQIDDEIRALVRFEKADLRGDLSAFGQFDLTLCRNVLIYFNSETRCQIISSLARRMLEGGMLGLGLRRDADRDG